MQALAEPLLADVHQVLARERRDPARLRIGAGENDRYQLGLLLGAQLGRAPVAPLVGKPVQAVHVVADDPIAQRLAVHACRLSRIFPAHSIERVGDRQHAPCHTRIGLGLRELA